jgi:hypothetical protein
MVNKWLLLFFSLVCQSLLVAGQNIPVGSWRTHYNYNNATSLSTSENRLFCIANGNLFWFNQDDNSIRTFTKNDGLNGSQATAMAYSHSTQELVIGYANGAVDFIAENGDIFYFDEIVSSDILASKRINDVFLEGNTAYLSTDFGVVLVDIENKELIDFYSNLNSNGETLSIKSLRVANDTIALATADGVLFGNNTGVNLKDFQNWFRPPTLQGLNISSIVHQNHFVVSAENQIYRYTENTFNEVLSTDSTINKLRSINNQLYLATSTGTFLITSSNILQLVNSQASQDVIAFNNNIWFASEEGLLMNSESETQTIRPQGPVFNPSAIENVAVFTTAFANTGMGFSFFANGLWNHLNFDTNDDTLPSFSSIAIEYISGNALLLSPNKGIYEWDSEVISPYGTLNSNYSEWLLLAEDNSANPTVWALARENGNLYLIDLLESTAFEISGYGSAFVTSFIVAPNGDKYIGTKNGLIIFNETSDETRVLTSRINNGNLSSNAITDLSLDFDGLTWIATEDGVNYFSNYAGVLTGDNVDAIQPVFEGFFLFDGAAVNSIAIDAGNRKWMATNDGAWLFDADITENLVHFTPSNSPLPTSIVTDISINNRNGEVFFLTSEGLLSFRSAATTPVSSHDEIKTFPNPVRLSIDNQLTVTGLVYNAEVKITDMAGSLVYKGNATGGSFNWNLQNYNGTQARQGVYLVFSTNEDGTETAVGKFAIIH